MRRNFLERGLVYFSSSFSAGLIYGNWVVTLLPIFGIDSGLDRELFICDEPRKYLNQTLRPSGNFSG